MLILDKGKPRVHELVSRFVNGESVIYKYHLEKYDCTVTNNIFL